MDTKSILQSKTFWANVVGVIVTLLAMKGIQLSPDDQATIIGGIMLVINVVMRLVSNGPVTITGAPKTPPVVPPAAVGLFLAAFLLSSLNACGPQTVVNPDGTTSVLTFAQQVAAFDAKAQADIKQFGADSLTAGKSACGYLSEANGLFNVAAPVLTIAGVAAPSVGVTEAVVFGDVQIACTLIDAADPTAPATPQIVNAITTVVAAIPTIKAQLAQAAPQAAAAATAQ